MHFRFLLFSALRDYSNKAQRKLPLGQSLNNNRIPPSTASALVLQTIATMLRYSVSRGV